MDDLKAKLAVQEAELKQKNEKADKLIHVVGVETEKVSKEKAIADEEEIKVEVINKVGRRAAARSSAQLGPFPWWPVSPMGSGKPAGTPQGGLLSQAQGPQLSRGLPSQAPAVASPELVRHAGSQAPALLNRVCILVRCRWPVSTLRLGKPSSEPWASDLLPLEPRDVLVPLAPVGSTPKVHGLG